MHKAKKPCVGFVETTTDEKEPENVTEALKTTVKRSYGKSIRHSCQIKLGSWYHIKAKNSSDFGQPSGRPAKATSKSAGISLTARPHSGTSLILNGSSRPSTKQIEQLKGEM